MGALREKEMKRTKMKVLMDALHKIEHKMVARVAAFAHLAYYGLVSVEAHGNYRYAAGAIGVILIVEAVAGGADKVGE